MQTNFKTFQNWPIWFLNPTWSINTVRPINIVLFSLLDRSLFSLSLSNAFVFFYLSSLSHSLRPLFSLLSLSPSNMTTSFLCWTHSFTMTIVVDHGFGGCVWYGCGFVVHGLLSLSLSHIFALFPPISPVSNSLSIFFSFSFAWPNLAFDGTSFSYLFLSHFSLYGLMARFRFRQHFVVDPVRLS